MSKIVKSQKAALFQIYKLQELYLAFFYINLLFNILFCVCVPLLSFWFYKPTEEKALELKDRRHFHRHIGIMKAPSFLMVRAKRIQTKNLVLQCLLY